MSSVYVLMHVHEMYIQSLIEIASEAIVLILMRLMSSVLMLGTTINVMVSLQKEK